LLLLASALVLLRCPRWPIYGVVMLWAAVFDLFVGEGPYCLLAYALVLLPPLLLPRERTGRLRGMAWMLFCVLAFEGIMLVVHSFSGHAALYLLLQHFLPLLGYSLLTIGLLLSLSDGLISRLHYQRSELHKAVIKGRLG
jgi:hypothetical protein